jgi:hypothetical protein
VDAVKKGDVTFPSKSGPFSSQILIGFPSKKFDRILSKTQMFLFPQKVGRFFVIQRPLAAGC